MLRWVLPCLRVAALGIVILAPALVRAQTCPQETEALLVVLRADLAQDTRFTTTVASHLQADLSDLNLTVCVDTDGRHAPEVARISLSTSEAATSTVHLAVEDTLTDKRVSRDIDLSGLPPDSRPFALAVACSELLRASWLEIALGSPPKPEQAPRELLAVLEEPRALERARLVHRVGVALGLEAYLRGELQVGADLTVLRWLVPTLGVELLLGFREGTSMQAQHGKARASLLGGAAALRYRPLERRRYELSFASRVQVVRATLIGRSGVEAADAEGVAWALVTQLTTSSSVKLTRRWLLGLELGAGWAVREAVALEERRKVAGVFGVQLLSSLRLATSF